MGYDMKVALHRYCYSADTIQKEPRSAMQRIGEVFGDLDGPVKKVLQPSLRRALYYFTWFTQVDQLGAWEEPSELVFNACPHESVVQHA